MDRGFHHFDAAEMRAVIFAQKLVVTTRQIDDAGALARLAQKLLHHVVVILRPIPAGLQLPAVDDVADQIDHLGIVAAQEVEKAISLAAARAEVNVGNEQSTEPEWAVLKRHRA